MPLENHKLASPQKGKSVLLLLGCALALCACQRQQAPPASGPPQVSTITVAEESVLLTTELPGRTSAFLIAEVRPQVNGLIQKRLFIEGSDVKEGQVLYQIDPAPFQTALDSAEAALARSEAALPAARARSSRYSEALGQKAVSQQDYDDASAALKLVEADIEYYKAMLGTARINLGYARVVSPISGRIGRSSVTDGAMVTAYQPTPLATIQQLDPIYVDVPQSTAQLLRLRQRLENGQLTRHGTNANEVRLLFENGAQYPDAGTLQFRDISVDPTTASVTLRMVFPNPDGLLLPGMFVRAVVKEGVEEHAILIPQQAVSRDPKGNPLALVVSGDRKVQQRMLGLDRAIGDHWLVSTGLAIGDKIIMEGIQKIRPGTPVDAVPFQPDASPLPPRTSTNPSATRKN